LATKGNEQKNLSDEQAKKIVQFFFHPALFATPG